MNAHLEALGLVLQAVFAGALALSSCRRLTHINPETIPEIRHSVWFLGAVAMLLLGAPYFPLLDPVLFTWPPLTTPAWLWLALACAIVAIQAATARHWSAGVPRCYIRSECRTAERRKSC